MILNLLDQEAQIQIVVLLQGGVEDQSVGRSDSLLSEGILDPGREGKDLGQILCPGAGPGAAVPFAGYPGGTGKRHPALPEQGVRAIHADTGSPAEGFQ